MKYIFSLVLVFIHSPVFPQNYQCVNSSRQPFFKADHEYSGIRIDSLAVRNGDTILYLYKTPRDTGDFCQNIYGPSWLGDSVIIISDGFNVFYAHPDQPFYINTGAQIGNSWTFAIIENGKRVIGEVSADHAESFIGLSDSVKTIILSTEDSSGAPSTSQYDGVTIKISKNFGLIYLRSFYSLSHPDYQNYDDYDYFSICGIENLQIGETNLTWAKIHAFNPGDKFGIHWYNWNYQDLIIRDKYIFRQILNLDTCQTGDSLIYTIKQCWKNIVNDNGIDSISYGTDTVVELYSLTNPYYDNIPHSLTLVDGYLTQNFMTDYYYARPEKTIDPGFWYEQGGGCWVYSHLDIFCMDWMLAQMVKGCGGPYYYYNVCGYNSSGNVLTYYKKGNIVWGTPISCETIGMEENETSNDLGITITPNPTSDIFAVEIPGYSGEIYHFRLYDQLGKEIMNKDLPGRRNELSRGNIPPGLYYYVIAGDNGAVIKGKIVFL